MVNFKNLLASVAILIPAIAALPIAEDAAQDSVEGRYIVTFKQGLTERDLDAHIGFANDLHTRSLARRGMTTRHEEGLRKRFSLGEHNSYTAVFDEATIDAISSHPAVAAVERDERHTLNYKRTEHPDLGSSVEETSNLDARADVIVQKDAPWGLTSLSFNHYGGLADVVKKYTYYANMQGEGIFAYVIDTGVRISHKEFEGRAINGANFVLNETYTDHDGHGTHLAGVIGGKTYGVAKKVTIISVKVADASGSSTGEAMLSGYEWIVKDAKKRGVNKCVVNISRGGSAAAWRDEAVEALHNAGITVFAAAGNSNVDASTLSPARLTSIFTVASLTKNDKRSSFSNFGKAVDVFAPGSDIISAGHKSDTATATLSGTSQACPHAVGVAAGLKSRFGSEMNKPSQVYDKLTSLSLKDIIGDTKGSANRILSNGFASAKQAKVNPNDGRPNRPPM